MHITERNITATKAKRQIIQYALACLLVIIGIKGYSQATTPYNKVGGCSYYADSFNGRHTSSGERFDNKKFTCAHRSLPFGTILRVTNLQKNTVVYVKVNDRGPQAKSRILDVSKAAAKQLELIKYGVCRVKAEQVFVPDSVDYTKLPHFQIPYHIEEADLEPGKYYNIVGDELHVKKAYSLELKTFDNLTDAVSFGGQCIDAGFESCFIKITEDDKKVRTYTFYYGAELFETAPVENYKKGLAKIGIESKIVRLP